MTEKPRWYVAVDPRRPEAEQGHLPTFDSQAPMCDGWSFYGPPCGGCDSCLRMQAEHAGLKVVPVLPVGTETLGDATARVVRETLAAPPKKVYFGRPGHCFDADGAWWHEPGGCEGAPANCDGKCCGFTLE